MKSLYKDDCYSMEFTNEEIEKYLLQPIRNSTEILIKLTSGEKKSIYNGNDKIKCIFFDGKEENFLISFYEHQTSIYIADDILPKHQFTFNEEFMFIDDSVKENFTSSDTYGNVVYEGTLRDKSHEEILNLFSNFIKILNNAKSIKVQETVISQKGCEYPKCEYIVNIINNTEIKSHIRYENILFSVNEDI